MFCITTSEFLPNKKDIDQYLQSLANARNTKRADQAEMKELYCFRTVCSCSILSLAPCQNRTLLEMHNAMTSVFWLQKICSSLRHLRVTVSNHFPVLSPDRCPPSQQICQALPSYPTFVCSPAFWLHVHVQGNTCAFVLILQKPLLACGTCVLRTGFLGWVNSLRFIWPVSDSSIEPLASSHGDHSHLALGGHLFFERSFCRLLECNGCKLIQAVVLSSNCKGSNDS